MRLTSRASQPNGGSFFALFFAVDYPIPIVSQGAADLTFWTGWQL